MNAKIVYVRDKKKFPVACVAFTTNGTELNYGYSVYNPVDKFDKKQARDFALDRLSNKTIKAELPENSTRETLLEDIFATVASNADLPHKIRKHAKMRQKYKAMWEEEASN